jgi:ribosomal protein L11 methyltransferase
MLQIIIKPGESAHLELLAAVFSSTLMEGLQLTESELIAYAEPAEWADENIQKAIEAWQMQFPFEMEIRELPNINWNEEWEKHFEPVIIEDILTIKADFHVLEATTRHEINIQPKMSFGTGHHATTWMMVKALSLLDLTGRSVLDAGTGTGILAILAAKWNAGSVIGFDNDSWSYENAMENLDRNPVEGDVQFRQGSMEDIPESGFEIVLANINRNFLLEYADALTEKVSLRGYLIISGFYNVDSKGLLDRFEPLNLVAQYLQIKDSWACIVFQKS